MWLVVSPPSRVHPLPVKRFSLCVNPPKLYHTPVIRQWRLGHTLEDCAIRHDRDCLHARAMLYCPGATYSHPVL